MYSFIIFSAVTESKLSNPSPSHHLWVRVRVLESESESKKNSSPSHKSSSPHIQYFFIFQKWKQTKYFSLPHLFQ